MIMIIQILKLIGTSTNVLVHDFLSPKFLVKQCFFANCLLLVACCMLFDIVAQSLKPVKLFSQQLATFLLFRVHLGVAQQCWAHARSLRIVYKDLRVVSFPRFTAGPNIFGSCCIRLHTTANTHATTPNIVGVVVSASTQPNMHQPASEFSSSTYK